MNAPRLLVVAAALLATGPAVAAESAQKMIVAGPPDDTIAARVQKELHALGFQPLRLGPLDGCSREAVTAAAGESTAVAAACSDGDQVSVWVSDGTSLRLRDIVVIRDEAERGREGAAVRAAEVMRATIALQEESAPKPVPLAALPTPDPRWEGFDRPPPKPGAKAPSRRAPRFVASAGMSGLAGIDAVVPAVSATLEFGVLRNVTATARLDYPLSGVSDALGPVVTASGRSERLSVKPAFAGAGIGLPLAAPSSFLIPRIGAGIGVAWLQASTRFGDRDTIASLAMHGSGSLSVRVAGPLRLTGDALIGSTTSRLVARNEGVEVAYWGVPFGALALRFEALIQ